MGKCDEANVDVSMGDSASPIKPDNFTFEPPPEAPVFEPTPEEFEDPIAYINKIRPIAEKCGICKIKPPENWQPPFAVDVDRLRFTPRIQRLNELEAITRVKLNFLDQILKFWELQGSALRIPTVDRKPLDLYTLHKIVQEAGGFEAVTSARQWSGLARRMGHPRGKAAGSMLKGHYERILYPYDLFRHTDIKSEVKSEKVRAATPTHTIVSTENRRSPRENKWSPSGPEGACGARSRRLREHRLRAMTVSVPPPAPPPSAPHMPDPLAKYMCHVCGRGDVEEQMLLCDGCDDSYHTFCLLPPLGDVPKGDWRCPACVAQEVAKPAEAFGFGQADREYTLHQFGEMADQFKSDYFNMPVHMVPTSAVEREFWRIVSSLDENVTVEYGADLHSMDHGSGFPTKATAQYPGDLEYAASPWNLNNLPVLPGSVLAHIQADISGMKVPWLYVGMCFAAFCWHNEDHWSYSINYLHWGEPKTWYGVPGADAERLEAAMRDAAPELFHLQPDLLHQLVTIMHPDALRAAGVPVYRTDQRAGEFVLTFPRAYHAGFNQGYNFAEAVNFAPADWVRWGRACVGHYAALHRHCVFSHDELVCRMSLRADTLAPPECRAALRDLRAMLRHERRARRRLRAAGTTRAARHAPELLPDDERQCVRCRTACFLSSVTCACESAAGARACLAHAAQLCPCPAAARTLRYRYTLDELPRLCATLRRRAAAARGWAAEARAALRGGGGAGGGGGGRRRELAALKALVRRADALRLPYCALRGALSRAVSHAEKCARVIRQLELHKMRTRTASGARHPKYRLTLHELTLFAEEIDALACTLPEGSAVKEMVRQTSEFESSARALLDSDLPPEPSPDTLRALEEATENGARLCIRLPRLAALRVRLAQARWLREARGVRDARPPPNVVRRILHAAGDVTPHPQVDAARAELAEIVEKVETWERKAKHALAGGNATLHEAKALLLAAADIPVSLPSRSALAGAAAGARAWRADVRRATRQDTYPSARTLRALAERARALPLVLPELDAVRAALAAARAWAEAAERLFRPRGALLDVLCPRGPDADRLKAMLRDEDAKPADLVAAFKRAEADELKLIKDLRAQNGRRDLQADPGGGYCTCGGGARGVMWQCSLCLRWHHRACVSGPPPDPDGPPGPAPADRPDEWRCADCDRSQRPTLDRLLALLVRLQAVPARVPEGEALQLVTERAMAWQDRARLALAAHRARTDHAYTHRPDPARPPPLPPRHLLHEGRLLEVSTEEEAQLAALVLATAAPAPTVLVLPARRTHAPPPARTRGGRGARGGRGGGRGRGAGTGAGAGAGRGRPPSASSSSDEEDCAADTCLRPTGKEVDWVQCDGGCELWFHMHCVGLLKHKLRPDDDYLCATCTAAHPPHAPHAPHAPTAPTAPQPAHHTSDAT